MKSAKRHLMGTLSEGVGRAWSEEAGSNQQRYTSELPDLSTAAASLGISALS